MRISLFIFCLCFIGCQQKKHAVDLRAKALNDSAFKIYMLHPQNLSQSIILLKQAVEIDSNFRLGYENIISFDMMAKDYEDALLTAKRRNILWSGNADYISAVGIIYQLKKDTVSSMPYFKQAIDIYSKVLDTMNVNNESYDNLRFSKANDLILSGQGEEAIKLLNEISENSKDSIIKKMAVEYSKKTGPQLIEMWRNSGDTSTANPF